MKLQEYIQGVYLFLGNNRAIGRMSWVFVNSPVDRGSIPGRVILKTKKNGTWRLLA